MGDRFGSTFAFVVVIFVLLVIVGGSYSGYGY
ncbi:MULTISPECIES: YjcZ family sporulation protein [Bacillus]|uniref:Uncharacterized protein (TIGR01732 family) n=1 Tax=Bacillus capparidis TaxID=1840411 RepID=A0ABS4D1Q4_9BACI|nr:MULTISPECIES: YjcZ family sporulation protein [Bacillus]MBP1083556.1 uncharacterized protein (TIGR01732 family) [Bacillus capparidis]MED1094750.1 YjcZ family sporulation protein [Bacillus capparidis]